MAGRTTPIASSAGTPREGIGASHLAKTPSGSNTVRPLLVLVALVSLAGSLYQLPLNRVIEKRLCLDYYTRHDPSVVPPGGTIPEELCKVGEVQQGLGRIQGVMETAWVVGGERTTPFWKRAASSS